MPQALRAVRAIPRRLYGLYVWLVFALFAPPTWLLTALPGWILAGTPLADRAVSHYQWALVPLPIALAVALWSLWHLPETHATQSRRA